MFASVTIDPKIKYPGSEDYFSPDVSWPEYRGEHLAKSKNLVYAAVRQCLADSGLDADNYGKTVWNPLGKYIRPGDKVFLLCNFVEQKVGRATDDELNAKCTHGSVVRALIDYVLIALDGQGSVRFGNAPLQSCNWAEVIHQTGADRVEEYFSKIHKVNVPVVLTDLRQHIIRRDALGGVTTDLHVEKDGMWVEVDLGSESLLDELCKVGEVPRFRVLDYDHRRLERCHEKSKHLYLMSRHIIDADVVISVPKLKTHEKVGITCGIKGCVGTIAHKDCLAHHRLGSPKQGGDEYPDCLSSISFISRIHDRVYSSEPSFFRSVLHSINYFSRKVVRRFSRAMSGSWPGNDTCWRMAVDLARIVEYADKSGKLNETKRRVHVMFTDGIVGGEGDGPLSPKPVYLGMVAFSDNVAWGDYVNCVAMGYEPEKLPMIQEAFKLATYCLCSTPLQQASVRFNGKITSLREYREKITLKFRPPKEWEGTL